jgi:integrase
VAAAGLDDSLRLYDLRHSCATLLFHRGVHPKLVSEILGHSSIQITLDTYSHVLPNMKREAIDLLGEALRGSSEAQSEPRDTNGIQK